MDGPRPRFGFPLPRAVAGTLAERASRGGRDSHAHSSAVPHLTSNPNPVAMGNQGSRLEIAVNRPVSRFAIDPAQFRELLGPRQVHIGSS